ncbi:hypothetical protein ALI144C_37345 [Actinosynnema sp. ALI-1.44]|uniref:hypothetical protein n=1 Tax=Actinosynnema sp. ALI-1.44 TaxID=1933779 RepID=UPI00097CAA42|nr:hypothetical protein [Actinosynnema sp. ALI-1.44]ONI76324.1 hypothetical protein ALI144C_37345 [Actinosynnema sp. ALI-1.44]
MDSTVHQYLDDIQSSDRGARNSAYEAIIEVTENRVDWAYDVWDEVVSAMAHKDNQVRSIASQILCNLAKSDPEERIVKDFPALLKVTKDDRFVTARHCLQSLWKVGVAGPRQQETWLKGMKRRFSECAEEKNWSLIRYDIIQSMRNVYDVAEDDKIKKAAEKLIESESDDKYRKKYATIWK